MLARLNAAVNRAIATPAFVARFGSIGDEPAGGTPEDFAATIRKDSANWADVIKRSARSSNSGQKNASVRISMLSRGRALGGEVGSSNAVWAVQRARPSLSES